MERLQAMMTIFSLALILLVLFSVRRAHIRVEYSVSWLGAGLALLIVSRSRPVLEWFASYFGMHEPATAIILVTSGVFLVVFYRFSVVISDLKDSNIALTQRMAILEYELASRREGGQ